MQEKQLSKQIKKFYSDAYKIGMAASDNGIKKEPLIVAIREIYFYIDRIIESLLHFAKKENTKIYCKKGCSLCCYQPVYALTHEIIYLKEFLNQNFSKKEIKEILLKADVKNKKLSGLTQGKLQNSKHPCPLLKNDTCIVYEARPMACRIYLSLSYQSCEIFYKEPDNKTQFPKIMHFPLQAGRMINEGLKAALKASGWDNSEFRIEEGLLTDLNDLFLKK